MDPEIDGKVGGDESPPEQTTPEGDAMDVSSPRAPEAALRQRALAAESKAAKLEARIGELEQALASTRAEAAQASRRAEIDRLLGEAGAIDLEAARLLVESALGAEGTDVASAIAQVKRRKAFLFVAPGAPSGAMSPAGSRVDHALPDLAREAQASGDRRTLLKYLRARRGS